MTVSPHARCVHLSEWADALAAEPAAAATAANPTTDSLLRTLARRPEKLAAEAA
jgi:hypothetical protein